MTTNKFNRALFKQPQLKQSQQGVALFICLMILLVVSVIGISAFRQSGLEGKISSNLRSERMLYHSAESTMQGVINEALNSTEVDGVVNEAYRRSFSDSRDEAIRCLSRETTDYAFDRPESNATTCVDANGDEEVVVLNGTDGSSTALAVQSIAETTFTGKTKGDSSGDTQYLWEFYNTEVEATLGTKEGSSFSPELQETHTQEYGVKVLIDSGNGIYRDVQTGSESI